MRGMRAAGFVFLSIPFAALPWLAAGGSDAPAWHPGKASDYSNQANEKVVIGVKEFSNPDEAAAVFGPKVDLNKYGFLPVLVVIENHRSQTLDLQALEVELVAPNGNHVKPVPADEIPYIAKPGQRPSMQKLPFPTPKKKNPMAGGSLSERAFAAKVVPAGDSASGFFYFEAHPEPDLKLYLSGLKEMPSGHELFYFEVGMSPVR
jgi:hypothetical protein